jgi:uncharacterized iron-regulated membrane protein
VVRKFLFQLHLWSGLILGILFVLIGLSGSVALLWRVSQASLPAVHVTAASSPALDRGLASARATLGLPEYPDATITLPDGSDKPVRIDFGGQMPSVLTDPGTGRVLATYKISETPDWLRTINGFHGHLPMRNGGVLEGWLGLVMAFVGLTGFYLWWPKRGQWKYGFIVQRKSKGLRFYRELHGAAGIWTLVIYLIVTVTGAALDLPVSRRAVVAFLTGEATPRYRTATPVIMASAGNALIGPDGALAAARKASDLRVVKLQMPGWRPGWPNLLAISADFGPESTAPAYIDPYHGTVLSKPGPPPNRAYRMWRMMLRLHDAIGLGPVYTLLVFVSGLMPLIFFITGLIMWVKKRKNRLPISLPLPQNVG